MFKNLVYAKLKTINNISDARFQINTRGDRSKIKIAVIDDKRDFFKEDFAKTGFVNVTIHESFTGLFGYSGYDVILCDIDGVSIQPNDKRQGIAVAKQLKDKYPEKLVFLYSGRRPEEYDKEYYKYVDAYFSKDLSAGELADKIHERCRVFWDPREAWYWTREQLLKNHQTTKSVAWLEDAYVRSFLDKKNRLDEPLMQKIDIASSFIKLLAEIIALFIS